MKEPDFSSIAEGICCTTVTQGHLEHHLKRLWKYWTDQQRQEAQSAIWDLTKNGERLGRVEILRSWKSEIDQDVAKQPTAAERGKDENTRSPLYDSAANMGGWF